MTALIKPRNPGAFITVEGVDGAGKTTQLGYIENWLTQHGVEVVRTREPGGTSLGEQLRAIVLEGKDLKIDDRAELLMMFAARQQHLSELILPALQGGKWVLCDRFTDATYAYQGAGRGIDLAEIEDLEKWVQRGFVPDLTLVLDVETEIGVSRSDARGMTPDRFEQQNLSFKQAVRQQYLERAARFPERMKVIDASTSISEVQECLGRVLGEFLQERRVKSLK